MIEQPHGSIRIERVGPGEAGQDGPTETAVQMHAIELRLIFLMRDVKLMVDALELSIFGVKLEHSMQEPPQVLLDPDAATIAEVGMLRQRVANTLADLHGMPSDQVRLQAALGMTHSFCKGLLAINAAKSGWHAIRLARLWMQCCHVILHAEHGAAMKNQAAGVWKNKRSEILRKAA